MYKLAGGKILGFTYNLAMYNLIAGEMEYTKFQGNL
jgi:hypothetical protein